MEDEKTIDHSHNAFTYLWVLFVTYNRFYNDNCKFKPVGYTLKRKAINIIAQIDIFVASTFFFT